MTPIITLIHIAVCFFLVVIVLLQHGKGADIGATFGGGNTVFGSEGPVPLLNKVTTGAAIIFMLTSITLAYLSAHVNSDTVMDNISAPVAPVEQPLETGPATVPAEDAGAPAKFPGQESTGKQAPSE